MHQKQIFGRKLVEIASARTEENKSIREEWLHMNT